MIKHLVKLANHLDHIGLVKDADSIDALLKKESSVCFMLFSSLLAACGFSGKGGYSSEESHGYLSTPIEMPEIDWDIDGEKLLLTHIQYVSFEECIYNPFIPQINGDLSWMRSSDGAIMHIKATWDLQKMQEDGVINITSEYRKADGDVDTISFSSAGLSLYFVAMADKDGICGSSNAGVCFSSANVYEDEGLALAGSNNGGYIKDGQKLVMKCYDGSSAWHDQGDPSGHAEQME